jgi:hypothetical protein
VPPLELFFVCSPQPINQASTFNTDLTREIGAITARELRACGLTWNFYPGLSLFERVFYVAARVLIIFCEIHHVFAVIEFVFLCDAFLEKMDLVRRCCETCAVM